MSSILAFTQNKIQKFPLIVVLATQVLCLFFLRNALALSPFKITPWSFVILQALASAGIVKIAFKLPHWLITISLLMPPLFFLAFHYFPLNGTFYGVAFLMLALTFSHTLKDRVPLYLTNPTTATTLQMILEEQRALGGKTKKFLDLGSGTGGVVRAMASHDVQSTGVESAPMLWTISSIFSWVSGKGRILRKNIWKTDLGEYDVVYAFLSPAVMEELWEKVEKEMRPGSLFISNSFVVPKIRATKILTLDDVRKTKLHLYQL